MMGFLTCWMAVMGVWALLTAGSGSVLGLWSWGELALGAVASGVVAGCSPGRKGLGLWGGLRRVAYAVGPFFLEMAKANLEVAWRVITGRIRPGIVCARAGMETEAQVVALANSITLTPGTLTVELRESGAEGAVPDALYVHVLAVPEGMESRGEIDARELFGRFDCPAWIRGRTKA